MNHVRIVIYHVRDETIEEQMSATGRHYPWMIKLYLKLNKGKWVVSEEKSQARPN